ncbi:MAG TPA: TrkA family potassium uptake protein [Euzebyales bacterium]
MTTNQYLIIGAGRFGAAMAETLSNLGHEVVVVDNDEQAIDAVVDKVTHAVILDATNEDALAKLGIAEFDTVVVAIGQNLQASILATVAAKGVGARHLISKADTALTARVLASVGADEVVRPEHDMGMRLARQLATPGIIHAFELGQDHRVAEVEIITQELQGSLADLSLPRRFGVQVIAVRRDGGLAVNPDADYELLTGDRLVVVSGHDDFDRFHAHVSKRQT